MYLSYLKKCRRSSYEAVHTRNTSPGSKPSKHVIYFIFNSPKYIFISPVLRKNQLYQVSSTVRFCNSISMMPFLILEKTCKQQAYRKAYWPSPNVVYFPVRVYSCTLSGTQCCPPRMTSRETDIVSVPEWLSIYGLLFANVLLHHLQSQFTPSLCAWYVQYVPQLGTGYI